ncbi:hypothetical protein [uncultured Corynebacterium sp.]|uniref:hypothetical protein n=1 Tax=uncultured Corynebacterium sp. TaxID=159447 RepID=UPI0025EAEBAF|nr:hypothetical protein [uncultured Corynebacterium sp.]
MATSTAKRYRGEEHFIDGYVPQSLNAEYSSLHRSLTWIGAGLWLASLAAWGTFIFGLAGMFMDSNAANEVGHVAYGDSVYDVTPPASSFEPSWFMWGGLIVGIVMVVVGLLCIIAGRKQFLAYRREFGTRH